MTSALRATHDTPKPDVVILIVPSLKQGIAVGDRFLMISRSKTYRRKPPENIKAVNRCCQSRALGRVLRL